jgi:glycosyltransferase involved in cell wall biosynthesis
MKRVGFFNATRYWQKYVFSNLPDGYFGKRTIDIPFHIMGSKNEFLLNTKWVIPFQNFDLYHTYNSIISINSPWVVEVESFIPRYGKLKEGDRLFNWGIKRLQHNSCKALIFTSEYTKNMNLSNMEKWGITHKGHVIYRAVELFPSLITGSENEFHILFVGNAFYRKGGIEFLKAIQCLTDVNIKITIVSNFEIDWAIHPTTDEIKWVKEQIEQDKRITCFLGLPHDKVIELMRKSNVFVGTTYADSFNNTILEAMACGMPIIATNIRAIPELVEDCKNGFTFTPNINDKNLMVDFIKEKLLLLINNADLRNQMALHSYKVANEKFSIEKRNEKLKNLYDQILNQNSI